ncbi:MAG: hypothetical protein IT342_23455 [Candidatus Melainabacteria bacterium]|nr:hypothetical protein [Candidatus Melainabacteria bacterium]
MKKHAISPNSVFIALIGLATICGAASAQTSYAGQIVSPSERIFQRAQWVFNNAEQVRYRHNQVPAAKQVKSYSNGRCEADTDCSGFASYLLSEFPRQYEAIRNLQPERNYPQAKVFMQFFKDLKSATPTGGWLKVSRVAELRRGDFIAWKKPEPADGVKRKSNSGHVAIVIDRQGPVEEIEINGSIIRYQSINVIDSSSVKHFQPEQLPPLSATPHRDGVGKGVVRIILDDANRPIGYWEGTYWYEGNKEIRKPTFTESIAFARLVADGN